MATQPVPHTQNSLFLPKWTLSTRPMPASSPIMKIYGDRSIIENLWKIVARRTGEELTEPQIDFSEFTTGDTLYPSMMKPEVKSRWDQKQYEKEEARALHAKLKRMVHAQFMQENLNLPVVHGLKDTTYGSEIQAEFKKMFSGSQSMLRSRMPQAGTSRTIRDKLKHDNVDLNMDRLGLSDTSEASSEDEDENTEPKKENENFYWTVTPKKNACEKCQALKGKTFKKEPERPHPNCNCKCEIERHFKDINITGILQGQGSSDNHKFGAEQKAENRNRS